MKLTVEQAAVVLVEQSKSKLEADEENLKELQRHLDSLRKNAKSRSNVLQRIETCKDRVESDKKSLLESEIIAENAIAIDEITSEITRLCEKRNNLTPGIVGADIILRSVMRNGF